jgi:hypothetical protein
MQEFGRKERMFVIAVRLDLDIECFRYIKWGSVQRCKKGDWIVNNQSDVYTVDGETFNRTYRMVSPGQYEKTGSVWAEVASEPGMITTKEGSTAYSKGDYLVFNDPGRKDGYAMGAHQFAELYEVI